MTPLNTIPVRMPILIVYIHADLTRNTYEFGSGSRLENLHLTHELIACVRCIAATSRVIIVKPAYTDDNCMIEWTCDEHKIARITIISTALAYYWRRYCPKKR